MKNAIAKKNFFWKVTFFFNFYFYMIIVFEKDGNMISKLKEYTFKKKICHYEKLILSIFPSTANIGIFRSVILCVFFCDYAFLLPR